MAAEHKAERKSSCEQSESNWKSEIKTDLINREIDHAETRIKTIIKYLDEKLPHFLSPCEIIEQKEFKISLDFNINAYTTSIEELYSNWNPRKYSSLHEFIKQGRGWMDQNKSQLIGVSFWMNIFNQIMKNIKKITLKKEYNNPLIKNNLQNWLFFKVLKFLIVDVKIRFAKTKIQPIVARSIILKCTKFQEYLKKISKQKIDLPKWIFQESTKTNKRSEIMIRLTNVLNSMIEDEFNGMESNVSIHTNKNKNYGQNVTNIIVNQIQPTNIYIYPNMNVINNNYGGVTNNVVMLPYGARGYATIANSNIAQQFRYHPYYSNSIVSPIVLPVLMDSIGRQHN